MSTKPTKEALPNGWQWMTEAPPWWEDHRADKWVCGALFLSGEDDTVWVNYSTNAGGRVTIVDGDHEPWAGAPTSVVLAVIDRGRSMRTSGGAS